MADFGVTKNYGTAAYPVHCSESSGLVRRCEPIITPEQLVSRYLIGIPRTFPNGDKLTDELIKDKIMLAVNEAELLLNMNVNREKFREKQPFDQNLYKSFIHTKTERGPILSVESLAIVASDGRTVYEIPPSWIEAANFSKRLINVIPLFSSLGVGFQIGGKISAPVPFLATLYGQGYLPSAWEIQYTAGMSFKEGQVPVAVNELIAIIATIDILSFIAPIFLYTSQSQSQDGISQSSSGLGPRQYMQRIIELTEKRETIVKKLKAVFSGKFHVSSI